MPIHPVFAKKFDIFQKLLGKKLFEVKTASVSGEVFLKASEPTSRFFLSLPGAPLVIRPFFTGDFSPCFLACLSGRKSP